MLTGTCHCGAATWRFTATPEATTACNCTICAKSGVLWIYGHAEEDVFLEGPTTIYRRADSGGLEFHFCPACGNTLAWRLAEADENGRRRMAVNLRLCDTPQAVMDLPVTHFDGLETFRSHGQDDLTLRHMWF